MNETTNIKDILEYENFVLMDLKWAITRDCPTYRWMLFLSEKLIKSYTESIAY
ncbi:hypothetical protein BGP_1426 [Beggiatoa sp. PS]|nr:hypothetical protein BGP_1426 [Beggiatoa sp. PS]